MFKIAKNNVFLNIRNKSIKFVGIYAIIKLYLIIVSNKAVKDHFTLLTIHIFCSVG